MQTLIWEGNTTDEITITNPLKEATLKYIFTNTSGSTITINIHRISKSSGGEFKIGPEDLSLLSTQQVSDENLSFSKGDKIKLTTSGAIDYYIAITSLFDL
jgi:hypothetical protein